jgi:erythromycin esterase-like protein
LCRDRRLDDDAGIGQRARRRVIGVGEPARGQTLQSHYFKARLPDQFDAILHFDETRAVEPLESTAEWEAGEVPETFPFAV